SLWPKAGPRLLWKAAGLGTGYSSPTVTAGRVYLMGARQGKELLLALDARDGKELWSADLGPSHVRGGGKMAQPGPRSTPTVAGDRVYALSSAGELACLTTAGKGAWRTNLVKDLRGTPAIWGYAESPLVDGDSLVCTPGGAQATLACLDRRTG